MNLQLVEKLRKLIAESSILNPGEKQEWEALLELMNDMQMRELEKILTPVKSQVVNPSILLAQSKPVQEPINRLTTDLIKIEPVKPKQEEKPQNNFVKPALGHIVNLPSINARELEKKRIGDLGGSLPANKQTLPSKPSFLQKLKAILREPELPAARHEELLPEGKVEGNLAVGQVVERPGIFVLKKDVKKLTPPPVPVPPVKTEIKIQSLKVVEPGLVKQKDQEELAKILRVASNLKPENKPGLNPKTQTVEEVLQKQAPKIVDSKGLEKWPDQYNIKQDPHKVDASKYVQKGQNPTLAKGSSGTAKTVNMEVREPKDLENLETSWLDETSVKKFKDLVKHFGNYEVMQYLEKSPLYKAYMLTGSQILQDASTFEAESKKNPQLLDKESFEKTADLLRIIQSE